MFIIKFDATTERLRRTRNPALCFIRDISCLFRHRDRQLSISLFVLVQISNQMK